MTHIKFMLRFTHVSIPYIYLIKLQISKIFLQNSIPEIKTQGHRIRFILYDIYMNNTQGKNRK